MVKDIVIDEVIDHFLTETYSSVQELKQLGSDVIGKIAENSMKQD